MSTAAVPASKRMTACGCEACRKLDQQHPGEGVQLRLPAIQDDQPDEEAE